MIKRVLLSIRGEQRYADQEPEVIEMMTEGLLRTLPDRTEISYEESELTGMGGVTTTFCLEPGRVTLTRTGNLHSQMVFEEGLRHESLYQTDFGTLMVTVVTKKVAFSLDVPESTVDVTYQIEVEQSATGMIDYHISFRDVE